jgi:Na+(H+)/acetate symporter ActP
MSAYWKIPLQALVLLVGVLLFLFYLFTPPPMLFNPVHDREVRQGQHAGAFAQAEQRFTEKAGARRQAATELADAHRTRDERRIAVATQAFLALDAEVKAARAEGVSLVRRATGDASYNDVNYVFPSFVLRYMPIGLVGLLLAAIFAAAMSTIASELNSLSTATVIDFYRRIYKPVASDAHYLMVSKVATGLWGLFACGVAVWAVELGSLIEVVNRLGSFFYGSILGVFVLAIGARRATGHGAFVGLIAGMVTVAVVASTTPIAFLWHNVVGVIAVVVVGMAVSLLWPGRAAGR